MHQARSTVSCSGGGRYLFVACLRHLTNDHASFSRRSTIPTPTRDTSYIRRSLLFFHILHRKFLLILLYYCFAVCGHHLSPRIAIVFSLLSRVPNFSTSRSVYFPHLLRHISFLLVHFTFSLYVSSTLLLCHKGTSVHPSPPPLDYWYASLFFSGRSRSPTRNRSSRIFT